MKLEKSCFKVSQAVLNSITPKIVIEPMKNDKTDTNRHDRKVTKGFDIEKIAKIWQALLETDDWMHIAAISARTGINECTVRWYIDHYLYNAVDQQIIHPKIKLRLIKLKAKMDFEFYIKALKAINKK